MIQCPTAVHTYNTFMNGVDRRDQLRNYCRVRLKCNKYYKYIFRFMFNVAITNAYILSAFVPTTLASLSSNTLKNFRLNLASKLIGTYSSRKRAVQPGSCFITPNPPPLLPLSDDCGPLCSQIARIHLHLPSHGPKRCVFCQQYRTPAIRKESVWHCRECPGQPTLCLTGKADGTDCFRVWHAALL